MRRSLAPALTAPVAGALALTLLVGACSSSGDPGAAPTATTKPDSPTTSSHPPTTTTRSGTGSAGQLFGSALPAFDDCDGLLGWIRAEATERVTAWGLPGYGGWGFPGGDVILQDADGRVVTGGPTAVDAAAPATAEAGGSGGGPGGATDVSATNVQEAGVDEADLVKSDGARLVAVVEGVLHVLDVRGDAPVELGTLALPSGSGHELFLAGDRALVLSTGWSSEVVIPDGDGDDDEAADARVGPPYGGSPVTTLVEVDLSDPADPVVARTRHVDGRYLSSRLVGDSARIVISAFPTGLVFRTPEGNGLRAEREALEHNRQVIAGSSLDDWLPYSILDDGDATTEGTLVDCSRMAHPEEFSGFGALTVLTVDLARGLAAAPDRAFGLFADGETVYASARHLVVATNPWSAFPRATDPTGARGPRTELHMFDIADPATTSYVGSGSVPGTLLSQWAMSEHEGVLRVASTTQPSGGCCVPVPMPLDAAVAVGDDGPDVAAPAVTVAPPVPESLVTTLQPQDGALVQVGQVGGLGRGEQIYAVRMIGDTGYVVTFRRVDPLYTVDLSDPANPTVVGELKIPGYSAYLHPVGDGLLLGVGQGGTDEGLAGGAQVSLFDVSDPAHPQRLDSLSLDSDGSAVEYDHRAFLYWEPTGLAVLPVTSYGRVVPDGAGSHGVFLGAVGVHVDGTAGTLETVGRVSHADADGANPWDGRSQILRSLVVRDHLLTLSATGVAQSDLATLGEQSTVSF
jgi:hypothetical protein